MRQNGGAEFIRILYKYSRPLPKILHVIVLMYHKKVTEVSVHTV